MAVKRQHTSYASYRPSGSSSTSSYRSSGSSSTYHSGQNLGSVQGSSSTSIASVAPVGKSSNPNLSKISTLLRTKVDLPPGYRFPPKLTEAEQELLCMYDGCHVCRQLFADHPLPCELLPPDASSYIPITQELINKLLASRKTNIVVVDTNESVNLDECSGVNSVNAVLLSASVGFCPTCSWE